MLLSAALWNQFGAAIDMLERAIVACPDDLWGDREKRPEFWYLAFHTLFYLDYYLADSERGYTPLPPFTRDELDPSGTMPARVYSKEELRSFLAHGRRRCREVIGGLTEERAAEDCGFARRSPMSRWELLLYNLRHVQHHAAQLNLILRQHGVVPPGWVAKAHDPLESPPIDAAAG